MEIYIPVHISMHVLRFLPKSDNGGYNMMFVMFQLYTALEMMQKGLRISRIG